MTGLELGSDVLVEIAVLVTDSELHVVDDEGLDIVIHASDETMAAMTPFVHEMHASSGLTDAVKASTVTVADAEQQVLAYIKRFVPEPKKAPLCGNSIATDRSFIARDMPELDAWLHYRMVDVSSVKELARRWYPRAYYASPAKNGGHRALADIRESIDELRYYRAAVFVPQPGPTTDECVAIAKDILGTAPAVPDGPGSADVPISELPREH
ncbi:MAG: oligoribonuclease [Frankiaceae bacterium]|jgi:oligoribonuclease|nr:oligoribonuclease [Frankiaceae bacterium]